MTEAAWEPTWTLTQFDHRYLMHDRGWFAIADNGEHRLYLSRYENEPQWIVDGLWRVANSYPVFHHGPGSRSTLLQTPKDPTLVEMLRNAERRHQEGASA